MGAGGGGGIVRGKVTRLSVYHKCAFSSSSSSSSVVVVDAAAAGFSCCCFCVCF